MFSNYVYLILFILFGCGAFTAFRFAPVRPAGVPACLFAAAAVISGALFSPFLGLFAAFMAAGLLLAFSTLLISRNGCRHHFSHRTACGEDTEQVSSEHAGAGEERERILDKGGDYPSSQGYAMTEKERQGKLG